MIKSFKDLICWQKAMELVTAIYKITAKFPREEMFGLTSQIRRAAVSIPSNIAEGRCRQTTADFLRFLSIANGSLGEVETQLIIARNLGFTEDSIIGDAFERIAEVGRLLNGLSRSLSDREGKD